MKELEKTKKVLSKACWAAGGRTVSMSASLCQSDAQEPTGMVGWHG